jgi:YVTN family beta-propeller protein
LSKPVSIALLFLILLVCSSFTVFPVGSLSPTHGQVTPSPKALSAAAEPTLILASLNVSRPTSLLYDPANQDIYVGDDSSYISGKNQIPIISTKSNTLVGNLTVGNYPISMIYNPSNRYVYVALMESNQVAVISSDTNKILSNITVANPFRLLYDPPTGSVFVIQRNLSQKPHPSGVAVIDGSINSIVANITMGTPVAMGYDPSNHDVYVTDAASNSVLVVSGSTYKPVATVQVGKEPEALLYNPISGNMYVANYYNDSISVISNSTNSVIANIKLPGAPSSMTYDPSNNEIYANDFAGGPQMLVSATTNSYLRNLMVVGDPLFDPFDTNVYFSNVASGYVSVVSSKTDDVLLTLPVGSTPIAQSYVPTNHEIYVANKDSSTISVISGSLFNTSPQLRSLRVVETGLAAGTNWTVTLGSRPKWSVNNTVVFPGLSGTYSYNVSAVAGYAAFLKPSTTVVNGSDVTVGAAFSQVKQLTIGQGYDLYPQWSPDGTKLLFLRSSYPLYPFFPNGTASLWVSYLNGTQKGPLVKVNGSSAIIAGATWGFDGSKIFYSIDSVTAKNDTTTIVESRLWTINLQDSKTTMLIDMRNGSIVSLNSMADGSTVFTFVNSTMLGSSLFQPGSLLLVSPAGGKPSSLLPAGAIYVSTCANVKRDTLAVGWADYGNGWKLTLISFPSLVSRTFSAYGGGCATWTPDNSRIIFNDLPGPGHPPPVFSMVSVNPQTGDASYLQRLSNSCRGCGFPPLWQEVTLLGSFAPQMMLNDSLVLFNYSNQTSQAGVTMTMNFRTLNALQNNSKQSPLFSAAFFVSVPKSDGLLSFEISVYGVSYAVNSRGDIALTYAGNGGNSLNLGIVGPDALGVGTLTTTTSTSSFSSTTSAASSTGTPTNTATTTGISSTTTGSSTTSRTTSMSLLGSLTTSTNSETIMSTTNSSLGSNQSPPISIPLALLVAPAAAGAVIVLLVLRRKAG